MEEQKKSNVVNMSATKQADNKLTYEQLNDACNQLLQQNRQLIVQNNELKQFIMSKRIDCLFKVLEYSKEFSSDFVGSCASEIEEALTVAKEEEKE